MSEERDPRTYFAAERTFLAWIRTGLALMGFGFVVARFGLFLREFRSVAGEALAPPSGFSVTTGTALVLLGVVILVASTIQHLRIVRDLSAGREFTGRPSVTGISLAVLLALVGLAMSAYLLIFR